MRHFITPAAVDVWHDGQWHGGTGTVMIGRDGDAAAAYRRVYPRVTVPANATFILISFPEPLAPPAPLRGRRLARAWFWVVTAAETFGFAVAAGVGALTADAGAAVVVSSLLAVGAAEGATLGWGQATVLRRALPGLSRGRWVAATAAAAASAYLMGLVPSTFARSAAAWPPVLLGGAITLLGCGLLGSIGTAQWLVLRRHLGHHRCRPAPASPGGAGKPEPRHVHPGPRLTTTGSNDLLGGVVPGERPTPSSRHVLT